MAQQIHILKPFKVLAEVESFQQVFQYQGDQKGKEEMILQLRIDKDEFIQQIKEQTEFDENALKQTITITVVP